MFKKYLHEPLVHFLVLGGFLFLSYAYVNDDVSQNDDRIIISKAEIKQLSFRWQKKHLRAPSKEELQTLIDKAIYQEVMYQESIKMGLENNDIIIKRRLVQKLEFVSSDMVELLEPSEDELLDFLSQEADRFRLPSTIQFSQLYLNPKNHKDTMEKKIEEIETLIAENKPKETLLAKSDRWLFPFEDKAWTQREIQSKFGKAFAKSLFSLSPTATYQGAIKSAYGVHFVHIGKKSEGTLPKIEEIRTILKDEWMTIQREKKNQEFYQMLKNKYMIEIEK